MSDPGFVHLHVHSFYSLLDGLARPSDIAATAASLGQKAVALTDHGAMYGIVEFSRACIEKGVKPIIGTEAYITEFGRPMGGRDKMKDKQNYHMLLLAENEVGYKNLIKLSSLAQTEGFYHKPRIDHELLAKYSEGIIATSGCMAAEIPSLLNDEHHTPDEVEAERRLNWYLDVFGRDRYFIEFQEHSIAPLQKLNYKLRQLADRNHVRMIATNDSHYARSTDTLAHDMILCINMQTTLSDTNRMSMATGEYYIKSLDEMKSALSYLELPDDAFYSTGEIADRCNVNVEYPDFAFPDIKIPDGYNYDSYLEELTWKGAESRYGDRLQYDEVLTNRIKHELNIIKGMKFSVYYLIVGDICAYAQRMGIWWNVRGSGAGSVVAYCTGITRVDPLKYGLIFERFLNPSRHGMPDFDLDFPDDSRENLIAYTMHKYGERSVAQIVSFSTIKSRGAIKDVGRLLGQDPTYMNTLTEMVPFGSSTLEDALKESPELTLNYQSDANVKNIVDLGMTIEGVKRNMSIHPAAVIITPSDVMNYVPLVKPPASAVTPYVTQFEYPICESLGLLKIDFLGLRTLTIMRIACDLIYKRYGIKYSLDTIPIDGEEADPAFKLLQTGYTLGVFQVESSGMQETLRGMQPTKVEHICAVVSLYRPGPMDYIPTFNRRMHGEEPIEYRHPKMEQALGETFGIMVYQEEVMQIAVDLAGYSGAESDNMRRAIGKKKEKDLKKHHEMFVEGCITHSGIDRQVAEDIYADILKFANYGFNKAHGLDYAVLSVQTAWLKAVYPIEFMAATLSAVKEDISEVSKFVAESKRMGIDVVTPDVNYSEEQFAINDKNEIVFALSSIKHLKDSTIREIVEERKRKPFKSLEDFCERISLKSASIRGVEVLITSGALDRLRSEDNDVIDWRALLLASAQDILDYSGSIHRHVKSNQMSWFGEKNGLSLNLSYPPSIDEEFLWKLEGEVLGLMISHNPVEIYYPLFNRGFTPISLLGEIHEGAKIKTLGLVRDVKSIVTKKGDMMGFLTLDDNANSLPVTIFPKSYAKYASIMKNGNVLMLAGKLDFSKGSVGVIADFLEVAPSLQ
jgi:DNA polymerase-3 subunit alpha